MNSIRRAIVLSLVGALGAVASAYAESKGCPEGMIEIRREQQADGHWKIYCKPIAELTPVEIAVLDPAAIEALSPQDRAALEQRQSPHPALPAVDPSVYYTPEWTAYARQQRDKLIARRAMLMRLEAKLQSHTDDFRQAFTENDNLARIVLEDDMASTLVVIGECAKGVAREGAVPANVAAEIDVSITTALTGLNAFAAARTADQKRQTEKVIEASAGIKNLLLAYPGLPLSPKDREALIRGSDALFKLAKIAQRHADGEKVDWQSAAAAADDVVDALTDIPLFEPGKAVRGTIHMVGAEYTLSKLQSDQAELKRAYQNHLAAGEFLNEKIRQTDEWLSVYQNSLKQQSELPQTSP